MCFQELYYKNYKEKCNGRYWEDPESLPYAVMVRSLEDRRKFEEILRSDGFECVVCENSYPCMYVNFTLKRYGRSVKPCKSLAINDEPMPLEVFMRDIYTRYQKDEAFRKELENNYLLSAQKSLEKSIERLESNKRNGCVNDDYVSWETQNIERCKRYIAEQIESR